VLPVENVARLSKLRGLQMLFGAEIRKVSIDYEPGTADEEIRMAWGYVFQSVGRFPLEARDGR
jgi:hypothetical protein